MNRTPEELIDAIAFALENDGIGGILIGDNEFARLVLEWRKLKADREKLFKAHHVEMVRADVAEEELRNHK
jgi:hypothetical protein